MKHILKAFIISFLTYYFLNIIFFNFTHIDPSRPVDLLFFFIYGPLLQSLIFNAFRAKITIPNLFGFFLMFYLSVWLSQLIFFAIVMLITSQTKVTANLLTLSLRNLAVLLTELFFISPFLLWFNSDTKQ
ncbi:MAG TPA: hypothetical protein PK639_00035 [Candidatus Woesebacteria bacterium]|nr:hypothetical protein [Candidatus Woesebacteria bacterium]